LVYTKPMHQEISIPLAKFKRWLVVVLVIILFGVAFNLTVNWDRGHSWHPDERMIIMTGLKLEWLFPWETAFYQVDSVFNPKFFAYGSLPIYLVTLAKYLITPSYYDLLIPLRWLGFIYLVVLAFLVKRLAGLIFNSHQVGLTAFVITFLTFFIWQNAHFYTVDLPLTVWLTLVIYRLSLWMAGDHSRSNIIWLAFGLAAGLATKFSMVIILPVVFVILNLGQESVKQKSINLLKVGLLSLVLVFVFQPYGLLDFTEYKRQIVAQLAMSKSAYTFPYTLQYVGTLPYLYPLQQIILWGLGPFLSLLALWGMFCGYKHRIRPAFFILTGFSLLYFLITGYSAVKFMRYYLPVYPLLIILAGAGLVSLFRTYPKWLGLGLFVLMAGWWAGFAGVQLKTPTRLQAAVWLDNRYPRIKVIGVEHWDDRLPTKKPFQEIEFPMYDPEVDNIWRDRKQRLIDKNLKKLDAYVIASPRLFKPIRRLSDKYPVAAGFYHRLFNRQTSLTQVYTFENHPRFLGLTINDTLADESFYVYDHPPVKIFVKPGVR